MLPSGLCWQYPLIFVWIIGIFLAIGRWRRDPQVSAATLIGLGCMLLAAIGQLVVFSLVLPRSSGSMANFAIFLQLTAAVASLIRAAGWTAMLLAIFGWRSATPTGGNIPLQFSIRGLLIATFVVAVFCGLVRGLTALLGESVAILLSLLDDIPVLLRWIFGGWVAWTRRHRHPAVSTRVITAILLQAMSLIVSVAALVWFVSYDATSPLSFAAVSLVNAISDLVGVVVGCLSWALLLAAAFGSRTSGAEVGGNPFREAPAVPVERGS
jgi:hypothetical protein